MFLNSIARIPGCEGFTYQRQDFPTQLLFADFWLLTTVWGLQNSHISAFFSCLERATPQLRYACRLSAIRFLSQTRPTSLFHFPASLRYLQDHQPSLAIEPVLSWSRTTNLCFYTRIFLWSRISAHVPYTWIWTTLELIHLPVGIGSGRWIWFVHNQKCRLELWRSSKHDVGALVYFSFQFGCAYLYLLQGFLCSHKQ
jgi:hypothetical protein